MATEKQLEANRINAQKSTGPKTDAGKEASRENALKHGMTARALVVLADEDPVMLDNRIDAFFRSFGPRDEFEDHEVTRLAHLSWKADRADRHEFAATDRRARAQVRADLAALREEVRGLAPRMLPPHEQVKESGYDALPAVELVGMIEATAEGCRWLLSSWQLIAQTIERRSPWSPGCEMSILRLSGFEMEWIRDPAALDLLVAGRVLRDPSAEPDPDAWASGPYNMTIDRKAMREACRRRPTTAEEASEVLRRTIDAAVLRLEELLTRREREGDALDVEESTSLALFDPGVEGERLRRYQTTMRREMVRIEQAIYRRRERLLKERMDEVKLAILYAKGDQLGVDWGEPPDLRNEANPEAEDAGDPDCADDEGAEEPADLRNEANPAPVALRNEANSAAAPVRNKAKFDLDEFDNVEWLDIPSLL